ncbi:MAG: glycosyl hydrolase family 28-related protein, partial [Victivallaceae bacterium]
MFTKSIFKTFAITVFLVTSMISSIHGAVVDVATPVTKTTIQNAVDAAAAGDVVFIPSGNWSIDGTVNLKEGIHVQGAGRDLTTLNKADQASSSIFKIAIASGIPFKISGINFKGIGLDLYLNDPNSTFLDKGVEIYGKAKNFHIYDCRFQRFTGSGVYFYGAGGTTLNGHAIGVINGNEFKDLSGCCGCGYGVVVYGDDSWPTLQLGDWNAVFVENNCFESIRHSIASNCGSRYVFRYNIINYSLAWNHAVDTHGKTTSSHGSRSYEIYNNSITGSIWEQWNIPNTWAIGVRGGDGVIFNNEIVDSKGMFVSIESWNSSMTYPVADQVRDLWVWGNTLDGAAYNNINVGETAQQEIDFAPYLQGSRDFHEGSAKSGYASYVYPHPISNLRGHWTLDNTNSIQVDA